MNDILKQIWCEQRDCSPVTLQGQGSAEHPSSHATSFRRPCHAFRSHSTLKQMNTCEKCICAYRKSSSQGTAWCCMAGRHRARTPTVGAPWGQGCRPSSHCLPSSTLLWDSPVTMIFFLKKLMGGQLGIPGTAHLTRMYPPNLPEANEELHAL